MNILFLSLFVLTLIYHIWDKSIINKRIEGELKFQSWSNNYNHSLKMNRESLLNEDQIKKLVELDQITKEKYNKEVPGEKGLFKYNL